MTETPPPESPPDQPPESPPDDDLAGFTDQIPRHVAERLVKEKNDARGEASVYRHRLRTLESEHADLQRQSESEQERRDREAYERGRQEAAAENQTQVDALNRANLTLQITGQIAERVIDPDVVVGLLPLDELRAIDDPAKRRQALDKALDELLKTKTYLARPAPKKPPLVTQGGRSTEPNGRPRERSWLRG
jgi:hypothetical protein